MRMNAARIYYTLTVPPRELFAKDSKEIYIYIYKDASQHLLLFFMVSYVLLREEILRSKSAKRN